MENYCPGGEVQPWPRPCLNFNEGSIIFYHSPNKKAVNSCFIHLIRRLLVCTEP